MPETIQTVNEKIKILKDARDILDNEYRNTEFHKKREANPNSTVAPSPDDEEALKLLTSIRKIEHYIKKYQDEQFSLLKKQDEQ
jgi:curved DNA-binding protein CbpA